MPLVIPQEAAAYERPPEGNHVAVCCSLVDLGTQHSEKYGNDSRKILVEWELSSESKEDGSPHYIDKIYTFSMNEKARLRQDLESWRGVRFSKEDFGKFELSNLLSKGCMLNIVHDENGDKVYANIASIARLPKGMNAPTLVKPMRVFSLEPNEYDADGMIGLREPIIEKIKASPEWAKLNTGRGTPPRPPASVADEPVEEELPF